MWDTTSAAATYFYAALPVGLTRSNQGADLSEEAAPSFQCRAIGIVLPAAGKP